MSSFLFVLWEGGGNVNPFLGLAEGLLARGHRVEALATASLRPQFEAAGIDVRSTAARWLPTPAEVMAAAAANPPDALVVDYMATPGLTAARALGAPTAALVHTLYVDLLVDGAPGPMSMAADLATINEERSRLDLPALAEMGDVLDECDLVIVTAPRDVDGPGPVPAHVRYTGPLFPAAGGDAGWEPPAGDGPLVVASMGTAGQGEAPVLQRVMDAMAGLPVRGFVTVPTYVDGAALSVPPNVTVSAYVRHAAVLPHADVVVTHAGLGTVTAALAWGVPMVCMPEDREQPNNAAAVCRLGAGRMVDREAGPGTIRAAIEAVLAGPRPAPRSPDGSAVDLIEQLATGD